MSTPWKSMEVAVWDYLTLQGTYTALRLHEFRGHSGVALPVAPKAGLFAVANLPAIASESAGITTRGFLENGIEDVADTRFTLVYATTGNDKSRDGIESAAAAISNIINGATCRRSRFGASATVADYAFRPDSITAIRGSGEGTIRFWAWQFTLTLVGNRKFLT